MEALAANRVQRIVHNPRILGGEPTVRGTRIAVRSIVQTSQLYADRARVLAAYPSLDSEDIDAALVYYERNREEVDRYIAENEADDED